jgi:hypothetical protein
MTIFNSTLPRVNGNSTFGMGILVSRPHFHQDHKAEDEAWASAIFNADINGDFERVFEKIALSELEQLERARSVDPFADDYDFDPEGDFPFEVDPVDAAEFSQLGQHLFEQEQYDPTDDLDGWDGEPDLDTLAGQAEAQEEAEMGISGPNRGFWAPGWGHRA